MRILLFLSFFLKLGFVVMLVFGILSIIFSFFCNFSFWLVGFCFYFYFSVFSFVTAGLCIFYSLLYFFVNIVFGVSRCLVYIFEMNVVFSFIVFCFRILGF